MSIAVFPCSLTTNPCRQIVMSQRRIVRTEKEKNGEARTGADGGGCSCEKSVTLPITLSLPHYTTIKPICQDPNPAVFLQIPGVRQVAEFLLPMPHLFAVQDQSKLPAGTIPGEHHVTISEPGIGSYGRRELNQREETVMLLSMPFGKRASVRCTCCCPYPGDAIGLLEET